MAKLFRSRNSAPRIDLDDHHLQYSSLLDPNVSIQQQPGFGGRNGTLLSARESHSRPWLGAVESRSSWSGERPPPRKIVKDMNSSCKPACSLALSDTDDGEKEKSLVRRQIERLKVLYRRAK